MSPTRIDRHTTHGGHVMGVANSHNLTFLHSSVLIPQSWQGRALKKKNDDLKRNHAIVYFFVLIV